MAFNQRVGKAVLEITTDSASYVAGIAKDKTATQELRREWTGLAADAKVVDRQIANFGKDFGGNRLLIQANSLAAAVQKLGGVERLTAAERAKANSITSQATEKYRALGLVAPKSLTDIEAATRRTDHASAGLSTTIAGLGKSIAVTAAGFFTAQAAYAVVRTIVHGIIEEGKQLTLHGAAVGDVTDAYQHLTSQAGLLGSQLLGTLRAGTHQTITDFDLMKTVNDNLAAGLQLTDRQMGILAKGSFALAQKNATDVKTALEAMNEALLTGRTRGIAKLVGTISQTAAEEKFAKSLNTTAEHLTDEGKLQAMRLAILEKVGEATDRLGEQTDGLDERVAQVQTSWANFEEELGKTIATSPVLAAALEAIKAELDAAFGGENKQLIRDIADAVDVAVIGLVDFAQITVDAGRQATRTWIFVKDGLLWLLEAQFRVRAGLRDLIPIEKYRQEAAQLRAMADSLRDQVDEAWQRQMKVEGAFDASSAAIGRVRARMLAATVATTEHTGATDDDAKATQRAAAADQNRAEFLKQSTKELSDQQRVIAQFGQVYATLGEALSAIREKVAGLTVEQRKQIQAGLDLGLSAEEIAKKMGLAILVVERYAAATKDAATFNQKLADSNREVAASLKEHFLAEAAANLDRYVDQLKSIQQVQTTTAHTIQETEFRRAEFSIEQAKRTGASWQQIYAMERDLAKAKTDAAIADMTREFDARAALLRARIANEPDGGSAVLDQQQLDADTAAFQAAVQQMRDDFALTQKQNRDELQRTHDKWKQTTDSIERRALQLGTGITSNIGTLFFGIGHDIDGSLHEAAKRAKEAYDEIQRSGKHTAAELANAFKAWHDAEDKANVTFAERFKSVWFSVKQTMVDILNDLLKFFTEKFLVGLVKGMAGAKLGQQFGGLFAGAGGGGGGGGLGSGLAQQGIWTGIKSLFGIGGGTGAAAGVSGVESAIFGGTAAAGAAGGTGAAAGAAAGGGAAAAGTGAGGTAAGVGGGIGLGTTVGLTAGIGGAALLAWAIWKKGLFRGGEGKFANDVRDKDLAQFAALDTHRDSHNPPGFYGLSAFLTAQKRHDLFTPFVTAQKRDDVRRTWQPIAALSASLGRSVKSYALGGFTPPGRVELAMVHGGSRGELHLPLDQIHRESSRGSSRESSSAFPGVYQDVTFNITISSLNPKDMRAVFYDQVLPEFKNAMRDNRDGINRAMKRAVALATV